MRFADINQRFTATVSEWLAKGYTINTATMRGSEGEIAKIDLTNGSEIIRVLLEDTSAPCVRLGERYYDFQRIVLTVGRATDQVVPNSSDTWKTVWNKHCDVLSCEDFYQIGWHSGWYGTREQAMAQQDLHWQRLHDREVNEDRNFDIEAVRQIVLPFVRRQKDCKSVRAAEVTEVSRTVSRSHHSVEVHYVVTARGHHFRLNGGRN